LNTDRKPWLLCRTATLVPVCDSPAAKSAFLSKLINGKPSIAFKSLEPENQYMLKNNRKPIFVVTDVDVSGQGCPIVDDFGKFIPLPGKEFVTPRFIVHSCSVVLL
jgi:hypothetical protein